MYLFPTEEELAFLWSQIDPKQRFIRAARTAINEACDLSDSMGGFYLNSQDIDMLMEDDAISMQCDVNGFRIHVSPPRCMESIRGDGRLNYKGKTFEYINNEQIPDSPNVRHASSWDEI